MAPSSAALAPLPTQPQRDAPDWNDRAIVGSSRPRLRDRLALLLRYRYLALTAFAVTTAAIVMEASTATHRYQATTRIAIDDASELPSNDTTKPIEPSSDAVVRDEMSILTGRDLARRTIAKIDWQGNAEYNDPAVQADETVRLNRFRQAVRVERLGPSRLVNLSFTALDSQFALRAVNALADEYVQQSARLRPARIVERAEVSRATAADISRWTWALALVCGLVVAIAVPVTLDHLSGKVATAAHVVGDSNLPFVGAIPTVRDANSPIASSQMPQQFDDSFKAIAAWLWSNYPRLGPKLVAVTSAGPFEGKTVTAVNVALALARRGVRVLLVDGNMRQPGVHRVLRLPNQRGLSQVLNGQARVRDVIQRTGDPNLLAIPAGRAPTSPAELLSSERMKALLATLSDGTFDWIVFDTPPVLDAIDAVILGPSVTGFLYVARADVTRRKLAARALKTIVASGAGSVAVVLNRVDGGHRLRTSRLVGRAGVSTRIGGRG